MPTPAPPPLITARAVLTAPTSGAPAMLESVLLSLAVVAALLLAAADTLRGGR